MDVLELLEGFETIFEILCSKSPAKKKRSNLPKEEAYQQWMPIKGALKDIFDEYADFLIESGVATDKVLIGGFPGKVIQPKDATLFPGYERIKSLVGNYARLMVQIMDPEKVQPALPYSNEIQSKLNHLINEHEELPLLALCVALEKEHGGRTDEFSNSLHVLRNSDHFIVWTRNRKARASAKKTGGGGMKDAVEKLYEIASRTHKNVRLVDVANTMGDIAEERSELSEEWDQYFSSKGWSEYVITDVEIVTSDRPSGMIAKDSTFKVNGKVTSFKNFSTFFNHIASRPVN